MVEDYHETVDGIELEVRADEIAEYLEEVAFMKLMGLSDVSGDLVIARYLQVRHVRKAIEPVEDDPFLGITLEEEEGDAKVQ